jgi:hypothetical protein
MLHCDTSIILKIFQFIGPSNDGQRYGRVIYLGFFFFRWDSFHLRLVVGVENEEIHFEIRRM